MLAPYQTDPHPAVSCLKQRIDKPGTESAHYPQQIPILVPIILVHYVGPKEPSVQIKNPDMKTKLTFKFYITVKTTFQIT